MFKTSLATDTERRTTSNESFYKLLVLRVNIKPQSQNETEKKTPDKMGLY